MFKEDTKRFEDKDCSGRPSMSIQQHINEFKDLVCID